MKFSKGFKILVVIILIVYAGIFAKILMPKTVETPKQVEQKKEAPKYPQERIPYAKTRDFSYLSLNDVLARRESAVKNSKVQLVKGYTPNKELYANIDSTKPWFGHGVDTNINLAGTIENSNLLVHFVHPYTFLNRPLDKVGDVNLHEFISTESGLPVVMYTPQTKTFDVYYELSPKDLKYLNKNTFKFPYRFSLTGINARDFGYEYVKATSLENVKMLNLINMANSMYKFKDYYGVGGDGYIKTTSFNNQVLPHQPELDFRITKLPAKMHLALYKDKNDKEPLSYNIHFYMKGSKYNCWRKRTVGKKFPEVLNMDFDDFQAFCYKNLEKIEKEIPNINF